MSDSYTKLFSSITESTIWCEPAGTRLLWITFLAKCNRHGEVFGAIPGIARLANITLEECEVGLNALMSPDPYSRTTEHEGRRIEATGSGWRILNHARFDRANSEAEADQRRRERQRMWDRNNRPSGYARTKRSDGSPTQSEGSPTQSVPPPALASDLKDQKLSSFGATNFAKHTAQEKREITHDAIATFNASPLVKANGGMLDPIRPTVGHKNRQQQVSRCMRLAKEICSEDYGSQTITPEFWFDYWAHCCADEHKSGRAGGGKDHPNWKPSFEYLTREATMLEVYDRASAEGGA